MVSRAEIGPLLKNNVRKVMSVVSFLIRRHVFRHGAFQLSKRPTSALEISTKIGCGLMCSYCPQKSHIRAFKTQNLGNENPIILERDNFIEYLRNVPHDCEIKWTAFSEPLGSRHFPELSKVAEDKGYVESISTTLIGDQQAINYFITNMEKFVSITIHLPDYNGLMKGLGRIEDIKKNYKALAKRLSESPVLLSRTTFFLIGDDVHEIALEALFCHLTQDEFKGHFIAAKVLNTRNSQIKNEDVIIDSDVKFRSFVRRNKNESHHFYCAYKRLNQGVMLPNGDVSICCQDYALEGIRGNLKKETLGKIYSSIESGPERDLFLAGKFSPCLKCEHYRPINEKYTGHA